MSEEIKVNVPENANAAPGSADEKAGDKKTKKKREPVEFKFEKRRKLSRKELTFHDRVYLNEDELDFAKVTYVADSIETKPIKILYYLSLLLVVLVCGYTFWKFPSYVPSILSGVDVASLGNEFWSVIGVAAGYAVVASIVYIVMMKLVNKSADAWIAKDSGEIEINDGEKHSGVKAWGDAKELWDEYRPATLSQYGLPYKSKPAVRSILTSIAYALGVLVLCAATSVMTTYTQYIAYAVAAAFVVLTILVKVKNPLHIPFELGWGKKATDEQLTRSNYSLAYYVITVLSLIVTVCLGMNIGMATNYVTIGSEYLSMLMFPLITLIVFCVLHIVCRLFMVRVCGDRKRILLTSLVSIALYALFGGVGYCANAQLFPGVIACLVAAVVLVIFLFIKGKVLIMPNVKGYKEFDEANSFEEDKDSEKKKDKKSN